MTLTDPAPQLCRTSLRNRIDFFMTIRRFHSAAKRLVPAQNISRSDRRMRRV